MKKNAISIESNLDELQKGDHIFSADFVYDGIQEKFDIKEFEFIQYLDKTVHIEGLDTSNGTPAEIFDVRFPKVKIKTDISYGFFSSAETAVEEFVKMIKDVAKKAEKIYLKDHKSANKV